MSIRNQALNELRTARDEAGLQAHLFSLDARERWRELEDKVNSLEQRLSRDGEQITETGLATARHLAHLVLQFVKAHGHPGTSLSKPVRSIMSSAVHRCFATDSLNRAAQLLWEANCGALPVVTSEGVLVGMITDRDICMAAYTQGRALSELVVAHAMSTSVKACSADDSITRVLEIMQVSQVRRVPIIGHDGHVEGMVSLADLAHHVGEQSGDRVACAALARMLAAVSETRCGLAPVSQAVV